MFLIFLTLALCLSSSLEWRTLVPNPDEKISFYVALHQNKDGVNTLKSIVLDKISNPDSPYYGKYLHPATINY